VGVHYRYQRVEGKWGREERKNRSEENARPLPGIKVSRKTPQRMDRGKGYNW